MSILSKHSVLKSISRQSYMLGWDIIIALDAHQANNTLRQEHLARLAGDRTLGGFSGTFEIEDISHFFNNVTLGPVQLDLTGATLQKIDVPVHLQLTGGSHVKLKDNFGVNRALSISTIGAFSNVGVDLEWPLTAQLDRIELDLADSRNVMFTWFEGLVGQTEAGLAFLDWFKAKQNGEQRFTLGVFDAGENTLMRPNSSAVRIQPKGGAAADIAGGSEEGALLLFASLPESGNARFPGPDTPFPYLIPAEAGHAISATAMFSQHLIHRAAFGHALKQFLFGGQFQETDHESGLLKEMRATNGVFQAPAATYVTDTHEFVHQGFVVPSTGGELPLTLELQQDGAVQRWKPRFQIAFTYRALDGGEASAVSVDVVLDLRHEFHFCPVDPQNLERGLEGHLYCPYDHTAEMLQFSVVFGTLPAEDKGAAERFVLAATKRAIVQKLFDILNATEPQTFLNGVRLAGESKVQHFDTALPFDQAVFSSIEPAGAPFAIVEHDLILAPNEVQTFTAEPAQERLTWTIQGVPATSPAIGRINQDTGEYTAPPAAGIGGAFGRVMVTATDGLGRATASIATVMANALALNPLVEQCLFGQNVELRAGLKDSLGLEWKLNNLIPSGGTLQQGADPLTRTYRAPPEAEGQTYALDEVEITQGNRVGKAYVLVVQAAGDAIQVTPVPSGPADEVQLKAEFGDDDLTQVATWSLPLEGPGRIEKGLYKSDPSSSEQFVLIFVEHDYGGWGTYSGHIILPLPLASHTSVLQALAR